uniref:Leucine-rich repeat-containing N-terminal plant-type domain-containing protein n=1 Tax=Opuntia streptacantha TaxID=393608 RepID=A0A7C9E8G2_OPUST
MGLHSYQCILLFVLLANYLLNLQPSQSYSCHDHEKSPLLHFKHSFIINCSASVYSSVFPRVKSWADERNHHWDCCSWDGVRCDNETGHVIGLDLSSCCLYGTFPSNSTLF